MGEKKRTVLTDAERIAKIEAELAAAKAKAEAKARKRAEVLYEQYDKLLVREYELDTKIRAVTDELIALGYDPSAGSSVLDDPVAREPEEAAV